MKLYKRNILKAKAKPIIDHYLLRIMGENREGIGFDERTWQHFFEYMCFRFLNVPLHELLKDILDTFRGYKNLYSVGRDSMGDIAYLLRGASNALLGAGLLLASPFSIYYAYKKANYSLPKAFAVGLGMPLASIFVGAAQIAASFFIPVRVLIRGVITFLFTGIDKTRRIEDSGTIETIVEDYRTNRLVDETLRNAARETLKYKAKKGLEKSQATWGSQLELKAAIVSNDPNRLFRYFDETIRQRDAQGLRQEMPLELSRFTASPAA